MSAGSCWPSPSRMTDRLRAGRPRELGGGVGRAVVDDDDRSVRERGRHHPRDRGGLVERGYQNRDGGVHPSTPLGGPSTTSATWVPPRATPWTRPGPRGTSRGGSTSRPAAADHAAAATRSAPSPACWPKREASDAIVTSGERARSSSARSHASRGPSPLEEL